MNTIALDPLTWDLLKDSSNDIAMLTGAAAIAQNVACALRLFAGELWFDTGQGIPYFDQVFNEPYGRAVITSLFNSAALSVNGVVSAQSVIVSVVDRTITGYVDVIDTVGQSLRVHF